MILSVILIKVVALISVLLMSTHRADMALDEVEATLQFEIATDTIPIRINPDGPLNFLRGYIYQKMECMYNKRFFAPQISTKYELKKECIDEFYEYCTYNRDRQMDRAYKDLSKNKMDEYNEQYHNHLIDLFPSPTGDITIETRGNQSFIQFLRAETTEKHALQILAMLLLFSEGVDIPIEVTNSVLKVYEKDKKDKIYFTVPMEIPWLNTKEEIVKFKQKKVNQMIKFFKKNATKHEVLSIMEGKCSYDEVATGKFLDSPKFLIQSYIFGFIDSAEHAIEFIQTVHTMLEKYAPKTEAPSKDDSVYDRLFKPSSTATGTDCMALMKSTQEIINMYKSFPFADSTQLPSYTSVPWRDPTTKEFSTDYLKDYSNCVECMILSLFCCLAYDPVEKIYRTDHMGNVSKELEEFFASESQPFDTTKAQFQKNWCRVVACLEEPRIAYCKKRNELDCGIINMLMVIAEIVNISEDEKNKVLGFSERLKEEEGVLENSLSKNIQEYTKTLLKRLSKTENVEIELSELKSNRCINGRYDVYGKIAILFEQDGIRNEIVLGISEGHSSIEIRQDILNSENARVKKLNEVADISKSGTEFVGNLFAIYVDYETRKLDTPEKNKEFMMAQVRKAVENNFADINRLLLVKKINDLEYKKELIACSIAYTLDKKPLPMDPIIRFTSNIIGSTELDNLEIQCSILSPIMCAGLLNKKGSSLSYPNIEMIEDQYENIMEDIMLYDDFVECVLDCDISIFNIWIKCRIDNFSLYNPKGMHELLGFWMVEPVSKYIFKDNNMEYANAVDEAIAQDYPEEKDVMISYLHYTWFMYLILQEIPNIELIKENFDAIQNPNYVLPAFKGYSRMEITHIFTELKDQLCTSEDSIAKFDELMRQYAPDPNSTTS
ncbi:hypothetical protein NERG_01213 [Nematocida ausubeli]|uniref:Uncharacterized protein n=1 Tax=Nematocida ausubeli (strain ATCC PRA-371 / ERTm2) TaxID=1913371 RepID=H8ZBX0_NEMA1|nr:hypothetical protein NERG_01213 [Nematocida ausubeli]